MGFGIQGLGASLNPLFNSTRSIGKRFERLSSGDRIPRASFDSAGLAISETLKALIGSREQGVRNLSDGVSLARVAEGNEISLHLNESLGFRHIGVMKEVGRKFGRLLDVYLMQKIYDSDERNT